MIWGIIAIIYAAMVVVLAITKPKPIWQMKKIQFFEKKLGIKGTERFFYIWAALFLFLGVWLIAK